MSEAELTHETSASGSLPGVPAISTLNVRSMVLFSNGDPLWSLEDRNDSAALYFCGTKREDECFMT